jgi:hypothetical protein
MCVLTARLAPKTPSWPSCTFDVAQSCKSMLGVFAVMQGPAIHLHTALHLLHPTLSTHSLLPRSTVVNSGNFQMSSPIDPLNLLFVARKLMSCPFEIPTGRLPDNWLSCTQTHRCAPSMAVRRTPGGLSRDTIRNWDAEALPGKGRTAECVVPHILVQQACATCCMRNACTLVRAVCLLKEMHRSKYCAGTPHVAPETQAA